MYKHDIPNCYLSKLPGNTYYWPSGVHIREVPLHYHYYVCVPLQDICSDPKFYTGGASRFDVSQGILGDCWLVAAIASLTQDKHLLTQVRLLNTRQTHTDTGETA